MEHHAINVQFFDVHNHFLGERKCLAPRLEDLEFRDIRARASLAIFMRNGKEITRVKLQ